MILIYIFIFYRTTYNFFLIDFEFAVINRTDHVLISGAITNSAENIMIQKLEGPPLIIPREAAITPMDSRTFVSTVNAIRKIFEKKDIQRMYVQLAQIYDSINTEQDNLNEDFINFFLHKRPGVPIIVFWNGETDIKLINRLGQNETIVLDMTTWDINQN